MDKRFLDKVIDQILYETELKYGPFNNREQWYVKFPFSDSPWEYDIFTNYSFQIVVGNEFTTHCRDIYGLNNDEINYTIKEFGRKLKELKPSTINESTGINYKFLDRVVDQIMSETIIEDSENHYGGNNSFIKRRIRWTFQPGFTNPYHINNHEFIKHCKDVYGLKDYQELDYVSDKFKLKMKEFVESSGVLNQPNNPTF